MMWSALRERGSRVFGHLRDPQKQDRYGPWLAVAALWLLFDLPSVFEARGLALKHFRPSADVLAVLTLGAASYGFAWGHWARRLLVVLVSVLVVYRIDEAVFGLLMHAKPLLYDQLFLLRHLFVLLSDLFSLKTILVVGGGILVVVLAVSASMRLLRMARPLISAERIADSGRVAYVLWLAVLATSGLSTLLNLQRPLVRWIGPEVLENVAISRATYRSLNKNLGKSPYREFDKVVLNRKPDVKLMLIESYGRLLVNAKPTRDRYKAQMHAMQGRLEADGWSMASGYSRSSVSGGRSWLAEGSLLMGTNVMHESVYRHLAERMKDLPNLVSFFGKQGYERVLVGPPDRERPGMHMKSPYAFDRFLLFNDLAYKGPAYGWGIVPDQYSMGVFEEKVLPAVKKPLFLDFHLVTSHAPWDPLPAWVEDYRTLNAIEGKARQESDGQKYAVEHLRRYGRNEGAQYNYMGKLDGVLLAHYEQAIYYELDVVEAHLKKSKGDQIVIVMGDHQPPVIASDKLNFDVPVHIFSRDKALLDPFKQVGFSAGLGLSPTRPETTSHAGLFSLLVRALRLKCGTGPVPPFKSEGHAIIRLENAAKI